MSIPGPDGPAVSRVTGLGEPHLPDERLETRIGPQRVEVRFDIQADEIGAPVLRAGLEQRQRLVPLANLRVAPGGGLELSDLLEGLSALAKEGVEAVAVESTGDRLRLLRIGGGLAQLHGLVEQPLVTKRAFQP